MSEETIKSVRPIASVAWLVLLLAWESFAPFFNFFRGAVRERVRHGTLNVLIGIVNAVFVGVVFVGLWWAAARWAEEHSFGVLHWLALPGWARIAAAILLLDLWTYWWHRMNHQISFFWRFHRVHHSDPRMDVTTANRFHLGEIAFSSLLRIAVIAVLGVRLWELALYETMMFAVVQWHHANVNVSEPVDRVLRSVLVTPFMHKVHHSDLQPETDSNYSSLFSFWDRIFQSFRHRHDPGAIIFGLREFKSPEHHTLKGILTTPLRKMSAHAAGTNVGGRADEQSG